MEPSNTPVAGAVVHEQAAYSLFSVIFKSGILAFLGWMALFVMLAAALVVVIRHFMVPGCHARGTHFFKIAHVCLLAFLGIVVVCGHIISPLCLFPYGDSAFVVTVVARNLISLSIGLVVVIIASVLVSVTLRRLPRPDLWSCLGLAVVATSIALIAGGILMISQAAG